MRYLPLFAVMGALLVSSVMVTSCVTATSPRHIGLKYDAATHTLKVNVVHLSPVTKIHYVYRVEVDKNGVVYQVHIYQKQPGIFLLRYTYTNVTATSGETLTVSAYCVLWGNLQKSMVVP